MGNRSDKEIRVPVKMIIEKGDAYSILHLLKAHFAQEGVQLTDKDIKAAVKMIIKTGYTHLILDLLKVHFSQAQEVLLTDKEIRAAVKMIIETGNAYWDLLPLLKAHFAQAQEVQLTDEEIGATIRELLYRELSYKLGSDKIIQLVKDYFPKLIQKQIVIFAKETAPNEMTPFLIDYSQELDSNRFQWIVEASSPLCSWSFWKKCPKTLSQEKLIILKKKVIDVERQKLIAILKAVSKHLGCFKMFVEYLNLAPWQDLRYLLPKSDR
jgi:hypothetical protein